MTSRACAVPDCHEITMHKRPFLHLGPAALQSPLDCKQQTVHKSCRHCGVMLQKMSGKDQACGTGKHVRRPPSKDKAGSPVAQAAWSRLMHIMSDLTGSGFCDTNCHPSPVRFTRWGSCACSASHTGGEGRGAEGAGHAGGRLRAGGYPAETILQFMWQAGLHGVAKHVTICLVCVLCHRASGRTL